MLALKLIILSLLACVFSVTAMPSHRLTNAERFAAGLPPIRPRKLFDATHVDTASRSRRSVAPNTQFTCSGLHMFAACCSTSDGVTGDKASDCTVRVSTTDTCSSDQGIASCCQMPYDSNCVVA